MGRGLAGKGVVEGKIGAFLCPAVSFYGGCAWGASVRAGFLDSRLTNPRTVATHSFGHVVWRLW